MATTIYDQFSTSGVSEFTPNSGIVWVKVNNKAPVTNNFFTAGNMCGYALYTTDEWNSDKPKTDLTAPGAPDPLLFLPAAGYRLNSSGARLNVGTNGYYWSSTIYNATGAYFLGLTGATVGANSNSSKIVGMSVRCVAGN